VKFHFKAVNGKKIQSLSFELNQLGSMATRTVLHTEVRLGILTSLLSD
jgi:hypothetical protein